MNSIDNMLIKSPCGSGKKYKNCCGRNQQSPKFRAFFYAWENAKFELDTNLDTNYYQSQVEQNEVKCIFNELSGVKCSRVELNERILKAMWSGKKYKNCCGRIA